MVGCYQPTVTFNRYSYHILIMRKFTKDSIQQGVENTQLSLKSVNTESLRIFSSWVLCYKCQIFLLDIKKLSTVFQRNTCAVLSVCFTSSLFLVDCKIYFSFKSWTTKQSLPSNLSQVPKSAFKQNFLYSLWLLWIRAMLLGI